MAGGGTASGAEAAVERLIATGATGLVSFGLAGGLDPALRPGTVIVPVAVAVPTAEAALPPQPPSWPGLTQPSMPRVPTDPALSRHLGGPTPHILFGGAAIVASAADKRALWNATGAAAIDLESAAVARAAVAHDLPFAVLRVICDPAERDLPSAALAALDRRGSIGLLRVIGSLVRKPGQLPALLTLSADAAAARRALATRVAAIGQLSTSA